jgi:hypothetical protein
MDIGRIMAHAFYDELSAINSYAEKVASAGNTLTGREKSAGISSKFMELVAATKGIRGNLDMARLTGDLLKVINPKYTQMRAPLIKARNASLKEAAKGLILPGAAVGAAGLGAAGVVAAMGKKKSASVDDVLTRALSLLEENGYDAAEIAGLIDSVSE